MLNLIVLYIKGYYWFGVNGLSLLLLLFGVIVSCCLVVGVRLNLEVKCSRCMCVVFVIVIVGFWCMILDFGEVIVRFLVWIC